MFFFKLNYILSFFYFILYKFVLMNVLGQYCTNGDFCANTE